MLGPAMDGGGSIASAEDAADGDDDDIDQEVLAIARVPRIGERFEVGAAGADVNELGHGSHPGFSPCGPWRRTEAVSDPGPRTGTKISTRGPSRQTTQTAQLYARALVRIRGLVDAPRLGRDLRPARRAPPRGRAHPGGLYPGPRPSAEPATAPGDEPERAVTGPGALRLGRGVDGRGGLGR